MLRLKSRWLAHTQIALWLWACGGAAPAPTPRFAPPPLVLASGPDWSTIEPQVSCFELPAARTRPADDHPEAAHSLASNLDGSRFVLQAPGRVDLYDGRSLEPLAIFDRWTPRPAGADDDGCGMGGGELDARRLALAPSGRFLAIGSRRDRQLAIWDLQRGALSARPETHPDSEIVLFSDSTLITASYVRATVRRAGEEPLEEEGFSSALALTPDGEHAVVSHNQILYLYTRSSGVLSVLGEAELASAAFSSTGRWLALWRSEGQGTVLELWDVAGFVQVDSAAAPAPASLQPWPWASPVFDRAERHVLLPADGSLGGLELWLYAIASAAERERPPQKLALAGVRDAIGAAAHPDNGYTLARERRGFVRVTFDAKGGAHSASVSR